jgi:hypothetical protein
MIEPADEPLMEDITPGVEPADDVEVVYVQAKPRKLRFLYAPEPHSDLTCSHGSYGNYTSCWNRRADPDWDEEAFYLSKEPLTHPRTGIVIPAGTPFLLAELTEGKIMGDDELVPVGDYMRMICLDPRYPNTEETLSFGWWHGVQEDQSGKFEKVENDMTVLAIAATGLAL